MLNKFVRLLGGNPNQRKVDQYGGLVSRINAFEEPYEALTDEQLGAKTREFKERLAQGETLDDILPEAFAVVREASKRTLGLRHYDVQLIGGIALHRGEAAEMRTGEGKTLVATLPLYLNALTGRGVHLVTVNDYLARRDARWNAPIYTLLGLKVGVLQMAARTENGKKAFLVDLERESPHEDQHHLRMVPRTEAYAADITYGTNSEFGFDYLRDNMTMRLAERVQRGHYYVIVDEVDNVLIDEARTPLIISGPAQEDAENYVRMAQVIRQLRPEDYEVNEKDRNISLTEIGETRVEELLGVPLRDPDRPEDITLEQARLMGYLEQAMRAQFLFRRNKDYLVQAGKVIIIDEFTGRLMPGRRWSDGLHQAVEAKEGVRVQAENVTYATITIQNYFRMYEKLAGMSGTAVTEAEEFHKIYKLEVVAIPTNLEYQAARPDSGLIELEDRDELGYKYKFYARQEDSAKRPVFWKRKDYPDVVYRTEESKFRAIAREILRFHVIGRPVLVGTTSVELSDRLSARLRAEPLRRLTQFLLLRDAWFERNHREQDGRAVAELQPLNQPLDTLQPAEMRKMSRELEISSNPQDPENLARLARILDVPQGSLDRLLAALQGGIPHQVLNARKHTEESQIIAGAGAFGAVTIATNMAGRGVDIRLGGEIPEDVVNQIRLLLRRQDIANRLRQNGLPEIDELPQRQWPAALVLVDPSELGARAEAVERFHQYIAAEEQVRQLGGLHVIGSERHEARRIDNQLRGRAARQGDPGSSRFYLSMEDELMRLFGGQQVDSVMQRLRIDDAMPLEVGVVGRLVEQSQTRVEGANFDVRKHLLEYDDVLNAQRQRIYDQRDRIFTKTDLSEDVTEMLRTEVLQRVPEALADSEGPWKLLAWLDQVQPTLSFNGSLFPSYTMRLVFETLQARQSIYQGPQEILQALLGLAADALQAEREHLWRSVTALLDATRNRLEDLVDERMELLDTFIQGLEVEDEESSAVRQPRDILDELSANLHLPLKLTSEQQRQMRSDPAGVLDTLRPDIENMLRQQTITRLLGAVERRLEEALELNADRLFELDWDLLQEQIFAALENQWERRNERLIGNDNHGDGRESGQIGRDLEAALTRMDAQIKGNDLLGLLMLMPQGARTTFDKRTHRRVLQRTTRLVYTYLAARELDGREPDEIAEDVLSHLEQAQQAIRASLGARFWPRLADALWGELDEPTQESLIALLGAEKCQILENYPLNSLDEADIRQVMDELGRRALTEIYRTLLLGVITELWVEYLTQMEALRVSIGLEAYAQRDPLVQYKTKASELFQVLFTNVRLGVVSRMFTYQPRELPGLAIRRTESAALEDEETEWSSEVTEKELALESGTDAQEEVAFSRRRRRRRR